MTPILGNFLSAGGQPNQIVGTTDIIDGMPLGSVMDEYALRYAKAFVGSTQLQTVSGTQQMYFTFTNPSNSGMNYIVTSRKISSNVSAGQTPLEYQAYIGATAILTETAFAANRYSGAATSSALLRYQIATAGTITMGGTAGTAGFIATNGEQGDIPPTIIMPPGTIFGLALSGSGGGSLQNQARLRVTIEWFEESI